MNPLLAALVAAGVIDQVTAERLNRQMDSEAARAWAEATLERANVGALAGQQERLIGLLRGNNFDPSEAQWLQFWHDENAHLWADLSDSYRDVASERAAARAIITAQSWSTWEFLNRNVDEWVNTYYTSPGLLDVGSVPNLNATAREQVADAFLRWTRGGRDLAPGADGGLPVLIGQLEPAFGPMRAKRIAVTETTRIFVEGNRSVNDDNPVITGYQVLTAADERVCPICGPLHGVHRDKASRTYQHPTLGGMAGPPFHVNCRCDEIEATSQTQGIALNSPWSYTPPPPKEPKPVKEQKAPKVLSQGKNTSGFGGVRAYSDIEQKLSWDEWRDGSRSSIKNNGAEAGGDDIEKYLAKNGASPTPGSGYPIASSYQKAWADKSNDHGGLQDNLQKEAERRLKAEGEETAPLDPQQQVPESITARAAYESIYDRTQAYFKAQGLGPDDTIVVYRGINLDERVGVIESADNVRWRPLSSWSTNQDTSKTFADFVLDPNRRGYVFVSEVPIRNIFSHWSTGFGCANEHEVVVLGRKHKNIKLLGTRKGVNWQWRD